MKTLKKIRWIKNWKAKLRQSLYNQLVKFQGLDYSEVIRDNSDGFRRESLQQWNNPQVIAEDLYDISEIKKIRSKK